MNSHSCSQRVSKHGCAPSLYVLWAQTHILAIRKLPDPPGQSIVHCNNSRESLAGSRYELTPQTPTVDWLHRPRPAVHSSLTDWLMSSNQKESVAKHTRTSTLGYFQSRTDYKSVEVRRQQSLDHIVIISQVLYSRWKFITLQSSIHNCWLQFATLLDF
jgi:hypothetical protein